MELVLETTTYHLVTTERSGEHVAHALRSDTGNRFGVETTGATADEAVAKLARWLEWQHEHMQALDVLQQAEKAYHRAMTGAAFSTSLDGTADAQSRASLEAVAAARNHLDDVRARRPNV
jgi:hypothetical protein